MTPRGMDHSLQRTRMRSTPRLRILRRRTPTPRSSPVWRLCATSSSASQGIWGIYYFTALRPACYTVTP